MVRIKEFLADPTGPDTGAEYISLFNDGDAAISLTGWKLQDTSGKTFSLSGYSLPPGKEVRFFSSVTKITLNNSNETVSLFDATGTLADELVLAGKATAGQPTVRLDRLTAEVRAAFFDDLAGQTVPPAAAPVSRVILLWLPISVLLALAAALVMRTIDTNDSRVDQKDNQSGANG